MPRVSNSSDIVTVAKPTASQGRILNYGRVLIQNIVYIEIFSLIIQRSILTIFKAYRSRDAPEV
jgi:hypothetical protein